MCSCDSVTPCFMSHNKILLICWYSPVMPPCEPQQHDWFCWTSVFYGCSYRGQPPVCDTLSCGELQCYSVTSRTNVNPSYTVIQSSWSYWSSWGQWRQTTFFRDCVTVMTVTKMALHWHSEFKWWQIDNAVDIDENTKQVLTYDKHDICKATLTTDGENMPVMASGGACYPCL